MEKAIQILVVDDDPDILFATVRILTKAGYDVDEADSVKKCWEKLAENTYDLILLDVILGDGTGLDILKKIKSDRTYDGVFVVMCSGTRVTSSDQADGLDLGADGYITRPFDNRHFLSYINAIVRIKRAEDRMKSLLNERELLIKEVHHRVKNNFNIVASLLHIQSNQLEDERIKELCLTSRLRITTMAAVHEQLYQSQDLSDINAARYLRDIAVGLFQSHNVDASRITLQTDIENVQLDVDHAIPCGLIVNEIMTNSFKYAFPDSFTEKGTVYLSCHKNEKGIIQLTCQDNGVGIPEDIDIYQTKTLGLGLVAMLVEDQLDGEFTVERQNGTRFTITFAV